MKDIKFVKTCGACPEQYEVYDEHNNEIAYLRLRHGSFTVQCPFGGEIVYAATPNGDGQFMDSERDYYLNEAKKAILNYYNK